MSGLIYPYDFENDTTADGEQVQEQFDAVKDFLADLNIDSGGIPYGSLDLSDSIDSGDIKEDAVGASELAAPTITQATASNGSGFHAGQVVAQVTVPATGLYFINADSGWSVTSAVTTDYQTASWLAVGGTPYSPEKTERHYVPSGNTGAWTTTHWVWAILTAGQTVDLYHSRNAAALTTVGSETQVTITRFA